MKALRILQTALFLSLIVFQLFVNGTSIALPVIPGANGFGINTPAGRGGQIIRVTNLNSSGIGSFKAAIEASGPRIVIFEVSGTIIFEGRYKIKNPFITIAGQSAPSPGITLRGSTLTIGTHDVLIQHIRVRTGDSLEGVDPDFRDAISFGSTEFPEEVYNIVIDHCSASWSIDETVEITACSNATLRNCIISEPLGYSLHSKGEHSKAMIISEGVKNLSILDNVFAHSRDRNPYINAGNNSVFIANNLIYNPGDFNIIFQVSSFPGLFTIVGNVVKPGVNSASSAGNNMPTFWRQFYLGSKLYLENNTTRLGTQKDKDDWSMIREVLDAYTIETFESTFKSPEPPLWLDGFSPRPSPDVQNYLLNNAGARPSDRDKVDNRIINDIIHGSGKIINSPYDVGGWPELEVNRVSHNLPSNPNDDDDNDGYTNIEEWLHDMSRRVEENISIPKELIIKAIQ